MHIGCAWRHNPRMSQLEEAQLAWQRAQADLQAALASLEKSVASNAPGEAVNQARTLVAQQQAAADNLLQRYITQLGKS
jgi:F0F1-type ATP synthase membrane subunit b/b'